MTLEAVNAVRMSRHEWGTYESKAVHKERALLAGMTSTRERRHLGPPALDRLGGGCRQDITRGNPKGYFWDGDTICLWMSADRIVAVANEFNDKRHA